MIRSGFLPLDAGFLYLQGYAFGWGVNIVKRSFYVDPRHTALFGAIFSVVDVFFSFLSNRYVPGPSIRLGPLPLGLKDIVSTGCALITTSYLLKVANYPLPALPRTVTLIGLACLGILTLSVFLTWCYQLSQDSDDKNNQDGVLNIDVKSFFQSRREQVAFDSANWKHHAYRLFFYNNPEYKTFFANYQPFPFVIVSETPLPDDFIMYLGNRHCEHIVIYSGPDHQGLIEWLKTQ